VSLAADGSEVRGNEHMGAKDVRWDSGRFFSPC